MSKINELASICKGMIEMTINDHRNIYQTAEKWLADPGIWEEDFAKLDAEIKQKMIETDTIIIIQFYPKTPVGFCVSLHYDIDAALDQAIEWAKGY